jgi:hypothetical protein
LVIMLLSDGVSNGFTVSEESVGGGLIAPALPGLTWLVSRVTACSDRLRQLAEGTPVVVGYNGKNS